MSTLFTSRREARLWAWTLVVVTTIIATLGVAPDFSSFLRERGWLTQAFWLGMLLVGAAIVFQGLRMRIGSAEIGVLSGVAAVYVLIFTRMNTLEERSHMIEYSIVALLILEALKERDKHRKIIPAPCLVAIMAATLIGALDESIQFVLPNRVFDSFDLLFNFLASVLAVVGAIALTWVRKRLGR